MDLTGNFTADAQNLSDAEQNLLRCEVRVVEISGIAYRNGQPISVKMRSDNPSDDGRRIFPEHIAIATVLLANMVMILARFWG